MNDAVLNFIKASIGAADVTGRSVLEVGSLDFNGSARTVLAQWNPATYVGVDMQEGKGVDRVLSVSCLVDTFGERAFDVVVSTEMLEHVQDWRWAISQLKRSTAPGGRLLVTTRSPGFHYHGYPHDFWRFTEDDFRHIFSDMQDVLVASDQSEPGVFVAARRPIEFVELDLLGFEVGTSPEPPPGPLWKHINSSVRNRLRGLRRRLG